MATGGVPASIPVEFNIDATDAGDGVLAVQITVCLSFTFITKYLFQNFTNIIQGKTNSFPLSYKRLKSKCLNVASSTFALKPHTARR